MSSDAPRAGRAPTPRQAIEAAIRAGHRAQHRIARDTLDTYLRNEERQESIERLLLRFGEALKSLPSGYLANVDPTIEWDKPIRFRDLTAHWYEEGLDHQLIWNVVTRELPKLIAALETFLSRNSV